MENKETNTVIKFDNIPNDTTIYNSRDDLINAIRESKHISNPSPIDIFSEQTEIKVDIQTIFKLAEEYKNGNDTYYNKELLKDFLTWIGVRYER